MLYYVELYYIISDIIPVRVYPLPLAPLIFYQEMTGSPSMVTRNMASLPQKKLASLRETHTCTDVFSNMVRP